MEFYRPRLEGVSVQRSNIVEPTATPSNNESKRFLTTSFHFIGDAIFAMNALEQITKASPEAEIDVLCTPLQAQLLSDDPRVSQLFPVLEPYPSGTSLWKRLQAPNTTVPNLREMLQEREYQAVFPGNLTIPFDKSLGAEIMRPSLPSLVGDIRRLKKLEDRPMGYIIRKIINQYFGIESDPSIDEKTRLYVGAKWIEQAKAITDVMKYTSDIDPEKYRLIIACPDTSSAFTRPRTKLMAEGIGGVLDRNSDVQVLVFPSFSSNASENLMNALNRYGERIRLLAKEPTPHLLYEAAVMDFADVVITPDTSTLHLAAAEKILVDNERTSQVQFKNESNVIALFGATNPALFSYPFVTTLGRGRKEQKRTQPGLYKNGKVPDPNTDYLSHIISADLTAAIASLLSPEK